MSTLSKIIELDEYSPHGERTLQIIDFDTGVQTKLASEALDYIRDIKPEKGYTYVLVLAMGASEAYGPNRNGDAFSERPVPGAVEPGETLLDCYKTFEDAGVYMHHVNKDKAKSMGEVVKAFYNPQMRRVELLLKLDNKKAEKVVSKIENGEFPAVSMGCRIKYDVCSHAKCRNKAATPKQYCKHARQLNEIDPKTGQMNFVFNPKPTLFDISFVYRPADRIGYTMKKVAHTSVSSAELGELVEEQEAKVAAIRKLSQMNKELVGKIVETNPHFSNKVLPRAMKNSKEMSDKEIDEVSKHPLPVAMSTLASMGVVPTSVEITKVIIRRSGGKDLPKKVKDRMPGMQDKILSLMKHIPEILSSLEDSGLVELDENKVDSKLKTAMASIVEKRSNVKDYVYRRAIGDPTPEVGQQQLLTAETPDGTYTTTRAAVETAQDANLERKAKILAGSGLLAGAGYKVLTSNRLGRALSPFLLGGAAVGTKKLTDAADVPNLPGSDIPVNTELYKASSFNDASVYAMLSQEYYTDDTPEIPVREAAAVAENRIKAASVSNPSMGFLANLDTYSPEEITDIMSVFVKEASDSIHLGSVDLESLAYWLGDALYS